MGANDETQRHLWGASKTLRSFGDKRIEKLNEVAMNVGGEAMGGDLERFNNFYSHSFAAA